jgi:acetyltransferase-like isoleucine patch superfamily enzyme
MASAERWSGTVRRDGSDVEPRREIPRAQDQLFDGGSGALAKYRALIVGRPGLAALVIYELVVLVTQAVPGALGLLLRRTCYPWLLGSCGRNVVFGQNVVLRHPHKIHVGSNVVIDDNCLIDAKGDCNAGVRIGSGVFLGRNTILSCKNGDIEIADGANIGFNCEVFSASRVAIGRDTLVAAYAYLVGGDHAPSDRGGAVIAQARQSLGISVGAGAWIGAGATVFDGVTIGDRAIIGAGAVVRGDVPAGATAVGVPARVLAAAAPAAALSPDAPAQAPSLAPVQSPTS